MFQGSTSQCNHFSDTIVALATPSGVGAIGVIRLSGPEAITIVNCVFGGKDLEKQVSHTIHFGTIRDDKLILDEVLVSLFIAPGSYTKENVVEISTHGSTFIIENVIKLLVKHGARLAKPGEFTLRAFLNGQLDLSQAEAVADLIASNSKASHQVALQQMRGGFSSELRNLREQLIHFASMIELELDFSEEDVAFANRDDLKSLIYRINHLIHRLMESFERGNVMKNGVPVVIAGKPNVGKSTLLNALLNEERAIVSEIAGTTRDTIEDEITIGGIVFRFIDTAGIRDTYDAIEALGVMRTHEKMKQARLIIYLFDPEQSAQEMAAQKDQINLLNIPYIAVINKQDLFQKDAGQSFDINDYILISAKKGIGIDALKEGILHKLDLHQTSADGVFISNIRHLEALQRTKESLDLVLQGLDNPAITSDFLALDIKQALHYLGEITGAVTTDDLLENIFSKFCIGK
ncbi:MAG: tRNA uridine-5-carboxymethylaminomethyl(34) synthesis GTPase MnmE [Pedobacter sp.]|nr:MAG: tRNA uridine-5-carboxymethylaminomethyl(34) synthesis GTPase MnmE [Pedobacter sp.]